MRPTFLPRLVNGPLFDPVVYLKILNERISLLFDCGRIQGLANREVLSLNSIFISHMHMDHFIGMDQVLRIILHRDQPIHVYGPEGITEKMLSKLRAYSWNLTRHYLLEVIIHEIGPFAVLTTHSPAHSGFEVSSQECRETDTHRIAHHPRFFVDAAMLDHNLACLCFVLKEPFHVNIRSDMIRKKGYRTGPWIGRFKECVLSGCLEEAIRVPMLRGEQDLRVNELMDELILTSPGQKIAYITDIRYSPENIDRIQKIAREPDVLFIEAYYLHECSDTAYEKGHLTAHQAGMIGKTLGAKRVVPMHVSPRYHHRMEEIHAELSRALESS
ncbi:MAG: MBL fold metallo-hydrolase [Desulfomonilia bacterium]